jgi:allantoin racemase
MTIATRILLLNPNTTVAMTDRLLAAAQLAASPSTTLVPLTAPRGVPYIATRAEAQIGGAIAQTPLSSRLSAIQACWARANCSTFRSSAWLRPRC